MLVQILQEADTKIRVDMQDIWEEIGEGEREAAWEVKGAFRSPYRPGLWRRGEGRSVA